MKRIKLFEAFNDTNKIVKVSFLLFCWCFESFIKEKIKDGSFEFITNIPPRFIVSDTESGTRLLIYDFYKNSVTSFNMHNGYYHEYFISKNVHSPYYLFTYQDEVLFVLKKLYQDEKNKTI